MKALIVDTEVNSLTRPFLSTINPQVTPPRQRLT